MARPLRPHWPGQVVHLTDHAVQESQLFLDDGDRRRFLGIIAKLKERFKFKIYAYCLMSNHWHILMKVGDVAASKIMQLALSEYAVYFNWKYEQAGHVFRGRFKSRIIDTDRYLINALAYIHLNPVSAGMVQNVDDYLWSGHAEFLGKSEFNLMDFDFPLSYYSRDQRRAAEEYAEMLAAEAARRRTRRGTKHRNRRYAKV